MENSKINKESIEIHKKHQGKISIKQKIKINSKRDLSLVYTPGVAAACLAIKENTKRVDELTNRANQVAIVSDGSAILGLGNIGAKAGLPVMEGKSLIFKKFANIDAFPLCINTQNTKEIIRFCELIEPNFSGINLEDISAPRCFDILEVLEKKLSIPVFHDDQDGTAIIVLAALINSAKFLKKDLKKCKIIINGAGAAGIASARLLFNYGIKNIILLDKDGALWRGAKWMNKYQRKIAKKINSINKNSDLSSVIKDADVFIGLSVANILKKSMVRSMNKNPIILAMANPKPEIDPKLIKDLNVGVMCTGRSDFPNQVNNALVFPGVFRALFDHNIKKIDDKFKLKVGLAIANLVKPQKNQILPSIMNKNLVKNISKSFNKIKI